MQDTRHSGMISKDIEDIESTKQVYKDENQSILKSNEKIRQPEVNISAMNGVR